MDIADITVGSVQDDLSIKKLEGKWWRYGEKCSDIRLIPKRICLFLNHAQDVKSF